MPTDKNLDKSRQPTNPHAAQHGIPGFHHEAAPDGSIMAAMKADAKDPGRADTGTGDQPGNTGGDRFATPNRPAKRRGR
jgi:hypothetical protein